MNEINGSMAGWRWKNLFIINNNGEILRNYQTEKYEKILIFENKPPLLMVTEQTSKGNGIHHLLGIKKDTIKEYLNTNGWSIQTIYGGFQPSILPYQLKDLNNDQQKDIVFVGKESNKPIIISLVWDMNKDSFEPKK